MKNEINIDGVTYVRKKENNKPSYNIGDPNDTVCVAGMHWSKENVTLGNKRHFNHAEALEVHDDEIWALPSQEQFKKLCKCPNIWDYIRKGRVFADRVEDLLNPDKSLFLPADGYLYYTDGQLYPDNQMVSALYWSWEAYNKYVAYYLSSYSTGTNPESGDNVYYGFSLRCIKR